MLGNERLKLWPVSVDEESTLDAGRIAVGKREVRVGTATTDVVLGDVQAVGKKRMPAADWARGTTIDAEATLA
jgi:methionyl-tRNA formyltransferase